VVDQLVAAGDQVEAPRPVDHYAYFGDRGGLDRFLSAAAALGFRGNALPTDQGRLGAHLVREDAVVIHHIHEVVSELRRLAEECGGEYDGWGCPAADAGP
jgi:regulator of RNase E activity RraB